MSNSYLQYNCIFTDYDVITEFAYHVPVKMLSITNNSGYGYDNHRPLQQFVMSKLIMGL